MPHHLHIVAIDLAKKVFHLVGSDMAGTILWRKRLTRHVLMPFIAQLPPVLIGLDVRFVNPSSVFCWTEGGM
jgi:hypothetical protein